MEKKKKKLPAPSPPPPIQPSLIQLTVNIRREVCQQRSCIELFIQQTDKDMLPFLSETPTIQQNYEQQQKKKGDEPL